MLPYYTALKKKKRDDHNFFLNQLVCSMYSSHFIVC